MRHVAFLMALLYLAGCGTSANGPVLNALTTATQRLANPPEPKPDFAARRAEVLTTVSASDDGSPVLLVELPELDAVASLVIAARNGDAVTWMDPTGVSVVTKRGVVIATRGLGHDLMAADVSGTLDALKTPSGSYARVHRYLDGEGHLGRRTFTCDVHKSETGVAETCKDGLTEFNNSFVLQSGRVARSQQWLGPEIGVARLTRLR